MAMKTTFADVDAYLAAVEPPEFRDALAELRAEIRRLAPDAVESISYGMPTYKMSGKPLIYFGAAKAHLAIYGTSAGTTKFTPSSPLPPGFLAEQIATRLAAIIATKH